MPATDEILGVHMIGAHVTELVAEASAAMLLEATAWEVSSAVHPHPTLSETLGEAAMAVDGQVHQLLAAAGSPATSRPRTPRRRQPPRGHQLRGGCPQPPAPAPRTAPADQPRDPPATSPAARPAAARLTRRTAAWVA